MNAMPAMNVDAKADFKLITPGLADAMLKSNTNNRNLRATHVNEMVRDMQAGKFQMNGDAIRFDRNGTLLDGQHRLHAISKSGRAQTMLVIEGLDPESMKTIDGGVKRTNGDRLSIHGVKNGAMVAAMISILNVLARNNFNVRMTPQEIFDVYDRHPSLARSAKEANGTAYGLASILGAFHYVGHLNGYGELVDEFVTTFKTGFSKTPRDPALTARERIIRMKASPEKPHRDYIIAVVATAWEAKRTGRELQTIRPAGYTTSPRIHGWSLNDLLRPQDSFC